MLKIITDKKSTLYGHINNGTWFLIPLESNENFLYKKYSSDKAFELDLRPTPSEPLRFNLVSMTKDEEIIPVTIVSANLEVTVKPFMI